MIKLTRNFEAADGRGSYWARQQALFVKQREEAAKRDKLEDRAEADLTVFSAGAAVATDIQIKAFEAKLDSYETATVEALIANDKAMEAVQTRIALMLEQAYVIEDGRRVFKTEDGKQVFDEFGVEVGEEFVSPDIIDDKLPSWEAYSAERELEQSIAAERESIIEYQERLDEIRIKIDQGGMTVDELEELDSELAKLMPPAVGSEIADLSENTARTNEAKPEVRTANLLKTAPMLP